MRTLSRIGSTTAGLVPGLAVVALLVYAVLFAAGYRTVAVYSGSMEPQLHGGHVCDPTVFSQQRNECQAMANLRPNTQDDPRLPNRIFTAGGSTNAIDPSIEASSSR